MRNHGEPFRHRRSQTASVIEVMMGDDYFRRRFSRHQSASFIDNGFCTRFAGGRLEQREMVAKFKENAESVARSGQPPDAFGDWLNNHGNGGRRGSGGALHRRGRGKIAHIAIDHIFRDTEIAADPIPKIDLGDIAPGKLDAAYRLVVFKRSGVDDVAQVFAGGHPTHRRGQMRCSIQGERQLVALRGGNVDGLARTHFVRSAQLGSGIQGGAHDGNGSRQHLDTAVHCGGVRSTLRAAIGSAIRSNVKRNVAV